MNYEEPSIDELIQSDLNNEMNKILQQSNDATRQIASTNQNFTEQNIKSKQNISLNEIPNNGKVQNIPTKIMVAEAVVSNTRQTNMATKKNLNEYEANPKHHIQNYRQYQSSSSNNDQSNQQYQSTSSNNDLSSLAWLSSVDIQQKQNEDRLTYRNEESNNKKEFHENQQNTGYKHSSHQKSFSAQQSSRYTPIQPNIYGNQSNQPSTSGSYYGNRSNSWGGNQHQFGYGHQRSVVSNHRYNQVQYHPYPQVQGGYGFDRRNHLAGRTSQKVFPKPVYSYSCLIAMSLQKSKTGALPVSDIYSFMMENFPYFKTAPDGWKNSVRHNLSLNKCFEKVEKPNGSQRKGCLWAMNPAKITKMEEEIQKWKRKDPESIRKSMSNPEAFDRELEELRRADEEAARRRLIGLANRGLPMINHHGNRYNQPQYHLHHQDNGGYHQNQINHYQANQFNQPYQQNISSEVQQHNMMPNSNHLQSYYNQQQNYDEYNQQGQISSGQGSFLDSLVSDNIQVGDIADLESSLGDLTSFQTDQFFSWDDGNLQQEQQTTSPYQQYTNEGTQTTYSNSAPAPIATNNLQPIRGEHSGVRLPSISLPLENTNSEKSTNEDAESHQSNNHELELGRISGDFQYITTNSKTVMLH